MDDSHWNILKTKSGHEVFVARSLSVPAYVPHHRKVSYNRKHRRVVERVVPAYPGYVFVAGDSRIPAHLFYSKSVYGFMREASGDRSALRHRAFVALRKYERDVLRAKEPAALRPEPLRAGEEVRIEAGFFDGREATVVSADERRVLAEIMGVGIRIDVPLSGVTRKATCLLGA